MSFLYGAFWAWLRRVYGGMMEGSWLGERGVQTSIMAIATMPVVYQETVVLWFSILLMVLTTAILIFQYWSRGHLQLFVWDKGNDNPTQEELKRYESRWYNWACQKIFKEEDWYTRKYDFMYIMLRYTCPMILLYSINLLNMIKGVPDFYISWCYIVIGALTAPIYLLCDWLNKKKIGVFGQYDTQLAEWIVGFVYGFGLWLINF